MKRRATIAVGSVIALFVAAALLLWQFRTPAPAPSQPQTAQTAPKTLFVAGSLTDAAGVPIANANVQLNDATTTTDPEGHFRFEDVVPGPIALQANAKGYIAKGPPAAPLWTGELKAEHPIQGLRLRLHEPARMTGTVVAGRKAIEARLTLLYHDATDASRDYSIEIGASASQTGRFDATNLAPGPVRVLAEAPGYALTESPEMVLNDGQTLSDVVIDLSPAGTLSGLVSDVDGIPIAGAELVLDGPAGRARRIQSQADGTFSFVGIPEGESRVVARANGYAEVTVDGLLIAPNEVTNADIVMEKIIGGFGRVFDQLGPVNRAFIFTPNLPRPAATASDGSFKVLLTQATEIEVVSPHHQSKRLTITPGSQTDVELNRGGMARGRVVDASGQPVTQAQVTVNWFQADGRAPYNTSVYPIQTVNGSDGSFEFGPLRPGRYTLAARSESSTMGESATFQIQGGSDVSGLRIELPIGATVTGRVTDESGNPVPRARVEFFEAFARFTTPSSLTDTDGNFRIEGVPPGRRSLRITARGYMTRIAAGIEVRPGENTRDVTLQPQQPGKKMSFGGIGAILGQSPDGIVIQQALDGKPAASSGLQRGDLIRTVDGQDVASMRLDRVVEMLRGDEGAPVSVEIQRDGKQMRFEITRSSVEVK